MYKHFIITRGACVKVRFHYPTHMKVLWCIPSGMRAFQVLACRCMLLTSRSIPQASGQYCCHHWRHARPTHHLVQDSAIISWISTFGDKGTPCDIVVSQWWVQIVNCVPVYKPNHTFRDILLCVGLLHIFTEAISPLTSYQHPPHDQCPSSHREKHCEFGVHLGLSSQ